MGQVEASCRQGKKQAFTPPSCQRDHVLRPGKGKKPQRIKLAGLTPTPWAFSIMAPSTWFLSPVNNKYPDKEGTLPSTVPKSLPGWVCQPIHSLGKTLDLMPGEDWQDLSELSPTGVQWQLEAITIVLFYYNAVRTKPRPPLEHTADHQPLSLNLGSFHHCVLSIGVLKTQIFRGPEIISAIKA